MKKFKLFITSLLVCSMLSGMGAAFADTETPSPSSSPTAEETVSPLATIEAEIVEAEPVQSPAIDPTEPAVIENNTEDITVSEPTSAPIEDIAIEETPSAEELLQNEMALYPQLFSDAVGVDISINAHQLVNDSTAHFNLFDSAGNLVGTSEQWIGGDTRSLRLQFSVPTYKLGEVFTLGMVDGLKSLTYYTDTITPGGSFHLNTYVIGNDDGTYYHGNNFALSAEPNFERGINVYYNGKNVPLWPVGRLIDGVAMVSAYDLASAMGLTVSYDSSYNSLILACGSKKFIFNIDQPYANIFGTDYNISHHALWKDGTVYVPVRDVFDAFGCDISLYQDDDHIDVIGAKSTVIEQYRNQERVNREGIYSRTNYLVWVSKSNYQVKVYQGSRYNWECIRTAPCAIGAPDSPTITGQFEYQYMGGRWDYPNFYVYPTLVFYGGYALHSTLRSWGGGMYDDSVGVMISHGCVRLHPADIDWIYATIPVGTRIYVTE